MTFIMSSNKRGLSVPSSASSRKTTKNKKNRSSSSSAAPTGTVSIANAFLRTNEQRLESLQIQYKGKYILLKSSAIYRGKSTLRDKDDKGKVITIGYGAVKEPGVNLPSGRNVVKYLDANGLFDPLRFFRDHKAIIPTIFIVLQ